MTEMIFIGIGEVYMDVAGDTWRVVSLGDCAAGQVVVLLNEQDQRIFVEMVSNWGPETYTLIAEDEDERTPFQVSLEELADLERGAQSAKVDQEVWIAAVSEYLCRLLLRSYGQLGAVQTGAKMVTGLCQVGLRAGDGRVH